MDTLTQYQSFDLLATLVAMAEGLSMTGFVKWFAEFVGAHLNGLPPATVLVAIVAVYFFSHYFFSSLTAHTSAMMPIMLGVGLAGHADAHPLVGVGVVVVRRLGQLGAIVDQERVARPHLLHPSHNNHF